MKISWKNNKSRLSRVLSNARRFNNRIWGSPWLLPTCNCVRVSASTIKNLSSRVAAVKRSEHIRISLAVLTDGINMAGLRNAFQSRMSIVENFLSNLHRAHSFTHSNARCIDVGEILIAIYHQKRSRACISKEHLFPGSFYLRLFYLSNTKRREEARQGRAQL